ncbi:MAG: outer membrane beta-barrel protein [Marinagarivorans sp.]|nr:outer membrane beta-barrel protein [Marinagarivorans sp.]
MKKLLLIALSTLAMGAQAADKNKFHVGGGLSGWSMKTDANNQTGQFNFTALEGAASYDLLPWLSLDGRLGVGMDSEREVFMEYGGFDKIEPGIETKAAIPATADNPATEANEKTEGTKAEYVDGLTQKQSFKPIKGELNYYASFLLKPQIKNDKAAFYGLIGVTLMDTTYTDEQVIEQTIRYKGSLSDLSKLTIFDITSPAPDADVEPNENSVSEGYATLGLGVSFFFNRWTLNTEWKSITNSDKVGDTGLSFKTSNIAANVLYSF